MGIMDYTRDSCIRWLKGPKYNGENPFLPVTEADGLEQLVQVRGAVIRQQDIVEYHTELLVTAAENLYKEVGGTGCAPLVVSHFWLQPQHPDPQAAHSRDISGWIRRAPQQGILISAIFMDFVSLPQAPRDLDQEAAFRVALKSMDLLYHPLEG